MVNGFRYYRSLESVSIASALSTALTIYPCQIRVNQRWQSKLQLPTARKRSGGQPQRAVHPMRLPVNSVFAHYFSRPRTRNLPIVGWLLVRRAAVVSPTHRTFKWITVLVCLQHAVFDCSQSLCRDQQHRVRCRYQGLLITVLFSM